MGLAAALDAQIVPLHHQVYVVLRQQISEGAYPPDRPMPAEHELCRLFGVSRITLRRALERLEAQGLINRQRGRGTFAQSSLTQPPIRADLEGAFENLLTMGLTTTVKLIECSYIKAPQNIASELQLLDGTIVQKAVRIRSRDGAPFSHLTTYVPEDLGRSYSEADLAVKPLLALLECAGVVVSAADETISAKLADPITGALLKVDPGTALIWVRRLVIDQNQRPVEYLYALYRPDLYEYQTTMSRVQNVASRAWLRD